MATEGKNEGTNFCKSTSTSIFVVVLIAQIFFQIIASTLYLMSSQFAPSIVSFCSICVCLLSIFAFVKNNFALIAVYIFLQPLYIAWNVFLLLLYLQVGPLRLPYPPPNGGDTKAEGSGDVEGSADAYTDDEDIRITRRSTDIGSTKEDPGKPWVDYLTLYTSKNADRSYLLSHESLQAQILDEDSFLPGGLTIGRLLEVILLLIILLLASIGFIASIFAYRNIKMIGREKYQSEFRYQSHHRPEAEFRDSFVSPRLEPSSRDHLLQNSCDRILQSHHSVSGGHSVNSYSQSRPTKQSPYNYRGY